MPRNLIRVDPAKFPWLDLRRYTFSMGVEKDGVAFISGQTASAFDKAEGHVVCKGDIADQCKVAWEKIGVILEAAGMSYENIVRTVDYITPQGLALYKKTADVRKQYLGKSPVASTGVMVHSLLRPEALIEVNAIAAKGTKEAIIPEGPDFARYANLTYAPGVRVGNKVWLSGITGPGEDTASQLDRCHGRINAVLAKAGTQPSDIINLMDYVAPQATLTYPKAGARGRYLGSGAPANSNMVVHRLLGPDSHVEVEATAVIGGGREEIRVPGWEKYFGERRTAPAVRKGNVMYISAQSSIDYATGTFHADDYDMASQARRAYKNLALICATAGVSMDAIAYTLELTPPTAMQQVRNLQQVRKEAFGDSFPAATGIIPHGLLRSDQVFSVVAIALV